MNNYELAELTNFIIRKIMRNSDLMFDDAVRGDPDSDDVDLLEVIASLHNMLYKEVTGEYYDYMFHWANKVGGWVYDDMFKPEDEKKKRI
jgi:hypothetical protein